MPALQDGHRLGQYRVTRLIGEGGMGSVYEARHESLDRRVAIKTLHPSIAAQQSLVDRFFTEAKVLSKLEHPSIVQVSDFGTAPDGTIYLVMEFLRGESLGKRLGRLAQRGERIHLSSLLQIGWQVADALAIAHALGVVHRDIKPDNLMLVADPIAPGGERVKLLDFGIAKLSGASAVGGSRTATNALMGTPMYMSPEQCAGAGRVDDKTDVYSLGCVLYQALAGRPPFEAEGTGELIGMHLYHSPPTLSVLAPKLPGSIVQFVHRMLSKNKSERPDMSSIADRLGVLIRQHTGAPVPFRSRPNDLRDGSIIGQSQIKGPESHTTIEATGESTQRIKFGLFTFGLLGLVLTTLWFTIKHDSTRTLRPAADAIIDNSSELRIADRSTDNSLIQHRGSVVPYTKSQNLEEKSPTPKIVHRQIVSEPRGAKVFDASGHFYGITPLSIELLPSSPTTKFTLRLDGFADATVSLDGSHDENQVVPLQRKNASLKIPANSRSKLIQPRQELGYEE